ncbi:MAG: AMP-binding protein [Thermodesulfobacteriota bacterium]
MELKRITIGDFLDQVVSKFPDREALIDLSKDIRFTYREFQKSVDSLAKGLIQLGLKKGDHVALWAPNRWEWIVTQFALAKMGAVLMSVDIHCQAQQLEYLLRQSDSKALVMTEGLKGSEYVETIYQLLPELKQPFLKTLSFELFPELKYLILISDRRLENLLLWKEVIKNGEPLPHSLLMEYQCSNHYEDEITLLYTSGTTGPPKGVRSSHFGLINTTLASAENQRLTENDRLCLSVPLSHMFGCICVTLAAILRGATLIIPSETFDSRKILEAIEIERCTAIYGSPSAFLSLMEDPKYKETDFRSLRSGIIGGAQCPIEVMNRVVEEMGVREIIIGYGLTESSSWITMTHPDDPLELRVSTVGKPLPGVEVKIIDPETGEEVPRGLSGEICARGLNMKGYYKMPMATANAIDPSGWLHTGDLGYLDEKGYLRTTGRLKEVINKGGELIYPSEIEEVLFTHPKISNVQVFGIPDKNLGEEIAVWIKVKEGEELKEKEFFQFCKDYLPSSKIPRYLKFVKEFPMTPLGKVQKFKMREIAIEEYGLE